MLKRLLVAGLLALATNAVSAAEPAGKLTTESIIKRTLEGRFGGGAKVDGVVKTPYLGLYEFRVDGEGLYYTDEKMNYIFTGEIRDAKSMENLTEKRLRELTKIKWESLPLESAVKTVRGSGKRVLAVFSDPNCPYCKRFEKDLAKVDDVTIYTFLYPILSQDSHDKSTSVWCSADRAKVWSDLMLKGTVPAAQRCETPIAKILELGRKYRITGTPTLIFTNGERVPGAISAEQVERQFAQLTK